MLMVLADVDVEADVGVEDDVTVEGDGVFEVLAAVSGGNVWLRHASLLELPIVNGDEVAVVPQATALIV